MEKVFVRHDRGGNRSCDWQRWSSDPLQQNQNHIVRFLKMNNKYKNIKLYLIIPNRNSINYRVSGIMQLNGILPDVTLVAKSNGIDNDKYFAIKSYPNILSVLNVFNMRKFKQKLERYVYFPSHLILYCLRARKILKKQINVDLKAKKTVVIITPVPPHDISLVGLFLKKRFDNIYWIMDWQDLWSYDEYYFLRYPRLHKKRLFRFEKEIIRYCDMNITTNCRAKMVLEKYFGAPSDRVITINHHFCPEEMSHFDRTASYPTSLPEKRTKDIGFLGNLFKPPKVPGERVVAAIRQVNKQGLPVRLHLFGDTSEAAKQFAGETEEDVVRTYEKVPHIESLQHLVGCDYFLLVLSDLPNCQIIMHQKLPHYLMLGKPIIAIVPQQSAAADIIRETGSGYVIPASSNWGDELRTLLLDDDNIKSCLKRNEEAVRKYAWDHISVQWLEAITRVCNQKEPSNSAVPDFSPVPCK